MDKKSKILIAIFLVMLLAFVPAFSQDDLDMDLDDGSGGDLGGSDSGGDLGGTDSGGDLGGSGIDDLGGTDTSSSSSGSSSSSSSSSSSGLDDDFGGADFGTEDMGLGFKIEKSVYEKKHNTKTAQGDKDPFFPLVNKPEKPPVEKRPVKPLSNTAAATKPVEVQIPDIELKVVCIVGNDTKRMALIEFEGKTDEYFKGDTKDGGFKIVDISNDTVTVYSLRKRRQRTFKLPE